MSTKTQGELIDEIPIEDIIRRGDFVSLSVFRGIEAKPDFWEITLRATRKDGKFYTMFDTEIRPDNPLYKFYKTKK